VSDRFEQRVKTEEEKEQEKHCPDWEVIPCKEGPFDEKVVVRHNNAKQYYAHESDEDRTKSDSLLAI